jgi:autotransporter-associated beta strand protein
MKSGVAKFDLGAGTVSLWVRAVGSTIDVSGPADASVSGVSLAGIQGIRINGYNGSASQSFDNLIIGTTLADVNATDTPPVSGTWTNTAGGEWNTAGNWIDSLVGSGIGTADFSTLTLVGDTTVQLSAPQAIGNLVFADVGGTYGWTLGNNGNIGNTLTLAGTMPTLTVNALGDTKTVTIGAVVAGAAGFVKSGIGTLTLSAANTYSGATTVSNGTLRVSGQRYFNVGRTTTVASNAVFELSSSDNTFTTLMPVSVVTGAGTFRLSGNSTINQAENGVNGIKLTFAMQPGGLIDLRDTSRLTNGGWQLMNWTDNKASLNIASGATSDIWDGQTVFIDALTGSGTFDKVHGGNSPSSLTVGVADGSGTFSGTIKNTGGQIALIKQGTGLQTLAGANSYGGTTTIQDGTLRIDGNSSAATGAMTVTSGASLGGNGSYGGSITLNEGAALNCDVNRTDCTLTCGGQLSFTNLDFADCTFTAVPGGGTFTLIEANSLGTVTFANAYGKIDGVSSELYISDNRLMLIVRTGTLISIY